MAHLGTYLTLTALCCALTGGCSEFDRESDAGGPAAAEFVEAGAQPVDANYADASGNDGSTPLKGRRDAAAPEDGDDASLPPVVQITGSVAMAFEQCSITPEGDAYLTALDVPTDLRGGLGLFEPLNAACTLGGFDLQRCAGHTVEVTSVREVDGSESDSAHSASVITLDGTVCCVYRGFLATPGFAPANCGPAFTARTAMRRCDIDAHPVNPNQTVTEVGVPSNFAEDPVWMEREAICREGQYDLSKCSGRQATLVTVVESTAVDFDRFGWKQAWILTHGSDVCCVWETEGTKSKTLLPRMCPELLSDE